MSTEAPHILHMFTPGKHMSPFDINMAADAGYNLVVPYGGVSLEDIAAMTQDVIFSRGPKGVRRTGIFIGGRDALLAMQMVDAARAAMVKPFLVSVMADPSGAYTTAAGLVASVEHALQNHAGRGLAGQRVLIFGGTGPVGRIAGAMAAQSGAEVMLCSHSSLTSAQSAAQATSDRFKVPLQAVHAREPEVLRSLLAQADVVLGCAAAGVQVASAEDLASSPRVRVLADVNAVPPAGLAGVGVMDQAQPVAGTQAVGLGALAIGNVKYKTQQQLLRQMREAPQQVVLGVAEALATARAVVAGQTA